MRSLLWIIMPIIFVLILGQVIFAMKMQLDCYGGNDRACFMISNRHDISIHERK